MDFLRKVYYSFTKSCTNFNFFNHVTSQSYSDSLKFIFVIILVICVVVGLRESWVMTQLMEDVLDWAGKNFPDISIKEGVLETEVNQPFATEYEGFPVLLDTTGEIKDLKEYQEGVLMKKDMILYKTKNMNTTNLNLERIKELNVNSDFITKFKKYLFIKIMPIIILFMYIYFSIIKFSHILLFSFLGMIVSKFKKKNFSYKEIFNISIYAFSPVALISIIFGLMGVHNTIFWLIYSGVYAFYIVGAIFYISPVSQISID